MEKMDIWIVIGALALCLILLLVSFGGPVLETAGWGLSFQGEFPTGPASGDALAKFDGAYLGDTKEKVIYLTFDAGYENGCTAQILDILDDHGVPAAFFLVGNYLERNADLVRRMVREGHTVGNHTMHHPDMSQVTSREKFARELEELAALYESTTGQPMAKFYRPPQGRYSEENLKWAQEMGYRTVFWSLAYADWDNSDQPDPEAALKKLLGRTHNGAVVLLHSTSKTNAAILDRLLTEWENMGYRFAPIGELFEKEDR